MVTMSQKSSDPQAVKSVSQALMSDNVNGMPALCPLYPQKRTFAAAQTDVC